MAVDNNGNSGLIIDDSPLNDNSVNDSGNGNSLASGNAAFSNNSFTDSSDNSTNDNSLNDNSVNDSGNLDVDVAVAVDSGNTDNSDNSDNSNNSDNDSWNDYEDSGNVYTDSFNDYTLIDRSIDVGVRQYNTNVNNDYNFGGVGGGVAAGGALSLDNRTTVVDQSVNQNIEAGDDVFQAFGQTANVASGDGSVAAGDDAIVDNSQTAVEIGDISAFNTEYDVDITDSFNEEWNLESNSYSIDIDNSGNSWTETNSIEVGFDNSFNDTASYTETNEAFFDNGGNIASPFGVAGNGDIDLF